MKHAGLLCKGPLIWNWSHILQIFPHASSSYIFFKSTAFYCSGGVLFHILFGHLVLPVFQRDVYQIALLFHLCQLYLPLWGNQSVDSIFNTLYFRYGSLNFNVTLCMILMYTPLIYIYVFTFVKLEDMVSFWKTFIELGVEFITSDMSVQLCSVSQTLAVNSESKLWFCSVVVGYYSPFGKWMLKKTKNTTDDNVLYVCFEIFIT
jgi:hypothetical protein